MRAIPSGSRFYEKAPLFSLKSALFRFLPVHMSVPKRGNSPFIYGTSPFMDGYLNMNGAEPIHVRPNRFLILYFLLFLFDLSSLEWTYAVCIFFVYHGDKKRSQLPTNSIPRPSHFFVVPNPLPVPCTNRWTPLLQDLHTGGALVHAGTAALRIEQVRFRKDWLILDNKTMIEHSTSRTHSPNISNFLLL